ncbi:hypothetical protein PHAVU_002G195700 [Phaseolus vulgaris]
MPANRNPNTTDPMGNAATRSANPSREPSFKNAGKGSQSFQNSKINSDSCSCVRSRIGSDRVVYNGGGEEQNFKNSTINSVKMESPTSSSETSSSSRSETTVCCSTSQSFNNHGTGSRKFNDAVINVGGSKGHPLSGRYRTTHNIYLHARVGSLGVRGVLEIPHRLEIRVFHSI